MDFYRQIGLESTVISIAPAPMLDTGELLATVFGRQRHYMNEWPIWYRAPFSIKNKYHFLTRMGSHYYAIYDAMTTVPPRLVELVLENDRLYETTIASSDNFQLQIYDSKRRELVQQWMERLPELATLQIL